MVLVTVLGEHRCGDRSADLPGDVRLSSSTAVSHQLAGRGRVPICRVLSEHEMPIAPSTCAYVNRTHRDFPFDW